jgi:hypothetical protein
LGFGVGLKRNHTFARTVPGVTTIRSMPMHIIVSSSACRSARRRTGAPGVVRVAGEQEVARLGVRHVLVHEVVDRLGHVRDQLCGG